MGRLFLTYSAWEQTDSVFPKILTRKVSPIGSAYFGTAVQPPPPPVMGGPMGKLRQAIAHLFFNGFHNFFFCIRKTKLSFLVHCSMIITFRVIPIMFENGKF
jgi:hypothetical protein